MLILGNWNILTRRMVGLHVNQVRWGKLILKMYAQKGEEFGLNIKQSFKTETLLQRLQSKQEKIEVNRMSNRAKLSQPQVISRWATLTK